MPQGENMPQVREFSYLTLGEGAINPKERINSGEIAEQTVDQFAERIDDYYVELDSGILIPTKCVDGRGRLDGLRVLGYNAAGGTFSLVMGDALTYQRYRHSGEKAPEHAKRVFGELKKKEQTIGGHDADHTVSEADCGCGAEDRLDDLDPAKPSILRYIARRGGDIRALLDSIGIDVTDEQHEMILANSQQLIAEHYATGGAALRDAFVETSGEESLERLTGSHNEVLLAINTQRGTTLDRAKIARELGPEYQAFNLDVPALEDGAGLLSIPPKEARAQFIAALYYNVATAAVLAGPSLRVVVR